MKSNQLSNREFVKLGSSTHWAGRSQLLISVRSAREAEVALSAGAEWVDVKEPSRGALGVADSGTVRQIVQVVAARVPVSVAMGELIDWGKKGPPLIPTGVTLAKFGLAGCRDRDDWCEEWASAIARLPNQVGAVSVIYADWRTARAPCPQELLRQAVRLGCSAALIDTYDKSRGGLADHWSTEELTDFIEQLRSGGLLTVVGGSISERSLPEVLCARPDIVAVRGAACRGGRTGQIDGERVRLLAHLVTGQPDRGEPVPGR